MRDIIARVCRVRFNIIDVVSYSWALAFLREQNYGGVAITLLCGLLLSIVADGVAMSNLGREK